MARIEMRLAITATILWCCFGSSAIIAAASSLDKNSDTSSSRIVGGELAGEHDFPWLVSLEGYSYLQYFIMYGSLITSRCIMTYNEKRLESINYYDISMGNSNLADDSKLVNYYTVKTFYHYPIGIEGFSTTIVVLPQDVPISDTLYPIRIPKSGENLDYVGETVTLAGWAHHSDDDPYLHYAASKVNTTIVPNSECVAFYGNDDQMTDNMMCTMGEGGACGDFGTPLNYFDETSGEWIALGFHVKDQSGHCSDWPDVNYRLQDPDVLNWIEGICGPTGPAPTSTPKPAFQCPSSSGIFADPDDCVKFYQCANNKPTSYTCPEGFVFNSVLLVCDFPENVPDCIISSGAV